MPIKFRPSAKEVNRQTKQVTMVHHYMKTMSKTELFEYINSSNAIPKRRVKCINELQRRGIEISWNTK